MSQTKAELIKGLNINASAPATALQIDASGNVNIDSNTLYVDATNNRAGIGTSSPSTTLEINGITTIRSGAFGQGGLKLNYTSNVDSRSWYVINDVNAYGDFAIQQSTTQTGSTYSTRLYINPSGLVGIGTSSPATALHTVGTVRISRSDDAAQYLNLYSSAGEGFIDAVNSNSGINQPIIFRIGNNSATTERARIDSSGRLLVGTSSNDSNALAVIQGYAGLASGQGVLALRLGTTRPAGADTGIGSIRFESTSNTSSNYHYASISAFSDGASSSDTDIPGRLVFSTTADGASSPTERMRISQNGKTDIYSSDYGLATRVSAAAGTSVAIYYGSYGATSTSTGTVSYQVLSNGNVQNANNSYGAYSDIKLKENIVDANSQWDDLKALQVRNYNFKEGQTHTQIGLVAQEVELVSPGLVSESPDRNEEGNDLGTVTKSVNYSVLYMKAVKALQEAMERIEQLETEMAAVKAQLS